MKIFEKIISCKAKFNSSSNPSIILRDFLGDNILETAYVYDSYFCEKFGTFPFPTNVKKSYFCSIDCYNCCIVRKKDFSSAKSYTCPTECVSKEKVAWSSCISAFDED
jgi:hypothetical protein